MTFPVAKLGEVCSFVRGLTYSKSDEVEFSSNVVVRATNIDLSTHKLDLSELRYISDSIQVKDDKRLKKNDILICTASGSKSHLGKVALVDSDLGMSFGGFMGALRVNPQKITPQFLFTFLVSSEFKRHIESLSDGANINNLKFSQIEQLELPLPLLATQQKIVAKLDRIFAEIDKATAAAEANAKNAEALFLSYLRKVFATDSYWTETNLGNDFELYQPQTITTKDLIEDGKYQVYGANGVIGRYDKYNHEEPQLLVTCRGATCGAVNVSSPFSWINGNAMVVKPKSKNIDIRFTEYFFRGAVDLSKAITGAAQPQITRQSLSPIKFSYPPVATQHEIVEKLDSVSEEINKSTKSYKNKVNELFLLKQSILRQAFTGELIKE